MIPLVLDTAVLGAGAGTFVYAGWLSPHHSALTAVAGTAGALCMAAFWLLFQAMRMRRREGG